MEKSFDGIPQGSVLGSRIFNLFLCDLFNFLQGTAVASYVDSATPYSANKTNDLVKEQSTFLKFFFDGLTLTT